MSREIKFRAWQEDCKTMFYNVAVFGDNVFGMSTDDLEDQLNCLYVFEDDGIFLETDSGRENNLCEVTEDDNWAVIYSGEPLQFTGLKDKKGKDIYEGDIVKLKEYSYNFKIEYSDGGFCLVNNAVCKYDLNALSVTNGEVIGNVFENPELLKGGTK